MTPEQKARANIDALLVAAGWHVCNAADAHIHAARGVAIREFPLNPGYGFADYLLYIDGKCAGVIEAKKEGATLTGVEVQSARYAQGLPAALPAWVRPLPFSYESTGVETHFTQGLDPEPRARAVFAFHQPATLAIWLKELPAPGAAVHTGTTGPATAEEDISHLSINSEAAPAHPTGAATFLGRMQTLPALIEEGLWPAQITAIRNLEKSLQANKPGQRQNRKRILTDLVSLVRFAMPQAGTAFTPEQFHWLYMIRKHIAGNLTMVPGELEAMNRELAA